MTFLFAKQMYFYIFRSSLLQSYKFTRLHIFDYLSSLKMLLSKYSWMFIKDCVSRALPLFFSFSISCCFISYSDCVLIGTLGKGLKIIILGGLIIQPGSGMQPYVPEFFYLLRNHSSYTKYDLHTAFWLYSF